MRHFIDIVLETHAGDIKDEQSFCILCDGTRQDGGDALDAAETMMRGGVKVAVWSPVAIHVEWQQPLPVAARNALIQFIDGEGETYREYYLDTMRGHQTFSDAIGFASALKSQAFDQY